MVRGVDIESLTVWMDARNLGAGPIVNVRALTGGTQNILLRFTREGRDYVLRRPPLYPRPNSNETMLREARMLTALAKTQIPHPRLIALCEDTAVLGAVFYLMEPIEGFNPVAGLPALHHDPAVQHRMGLAVVETLAALGSLDHVALGLQVFGRPEGFLERQVARWQSQLDGYGQFADWPGPAALGDVTGIGAWLEANRPASCAPGIIHGDYHLANMMFHVDSAEMAAVVDWELATIGDPLVDLGWLLATWPEAGEEGTISVRPWIGFPTSAELVAHYTASGGRATEAISWYAILGCYKLGILLEGTYARACAGKAPAETGEKLHKRSLWLFQRADRWLRDGHPAAQSREGCRQQ